MKIRDSFARARRELRHRVFGQQRETNTPYGRTRQIAEHKSQRVFSANFVLAIGDGEQCVEFIDPATKKLQ
jgi:hypothetical protein